MNLHDGATLSQVYAVRINEESPSWYVFQYAEDDSQDPDYMQGVMSQFFLSHFKAPEWYCFTETEKNVVFDMACEMFDAPQQVSEKASLIFHYFQKHAMEEVPGAVLFIAFFSEVVVDDEITEAIGIFKANAHDTFLQFDSGEEKLGMSVAQGMFTGQPQTGVLIVNTQRGNGFKVCPSFSKTRSAEATFWRDNLLKITEAVDDYHHTKHYIQATKKFIKDTLPEMMEMDKATEAALMQRSFEYFKEEESFDVGAYEVKVFKDQEVVEAFRDFREAYDQEKPGMLAEQFEISESAVKKQSNVFKSVIKLDKNFHIYVHGDRSKIRKGTDEEGKKFYMIYYEDES